MRKPTICICENKDADQLRGNREADQRLCFRYTDSTMSLLLKSEVVFFDYRLVCVGPVRNPNCWFSHAQARLKVSYSSNFSCLVCLCSSIQTLYFNEILFKPNNSTFNYIWVSYTRYVWSSILLCPLETSFSVKININFTYLQHS